MAQVGTTCLQIYWWGGATLDAKTRQKIIQGEYIDLGVLAPRSDSASSLNVRHTQGYNSQVSLTPSRPRQAADIFEWIRWFSIYAAVYTEKWPASSPQMWTYLPKIIRLYKKTPNSFVWRTYDELFRRMKEKSPKLPWHVINPHLMEEAEEILLIQQSTKKREQGKGKDGQKFIKLPSNGTCHRYNRGRECQVSKCKFSHTCSHCRADHPAVRCKSVSSQVSNDEKANK